MGRLGAIACLLLTLSMPGDETIKEPPTRPVSIRIVPSAFREKTGRSIELHQPSQHFYVVVTNTSGEPIRLWREWCSWGYFNLSFVVTGEGEKAVAVTKKPRGWDRNVPDWSIVPPGGHMVFEVAFDEAIWQNAPLPAGGRPRAIEMKAIYEVPADDEARKHGVWSGRIVSPEETYTIYR